jgi:hypothetical protein
MTQIIKIEVPLDGAKCLSRAMNYYVEQFDDGRGPEVFANDFEGEWRLSSDLLHALADLAFPAEEGDNQ